MTNRDSKYAVEMQDISKIYTLKTKNKGKKKEQFYALKDVSFQIKKGDVVGILGTNGSGKSTLSLILAGISDHDGGKMIVNGEQALISINTGLNMQLTGEENINVKGALMGFSISLALNPDIFIVDEALSVGDKGFAQKCMKRMMQLRDEENKTIFFISHSLSQVRSFCKTGMWIEGGKLVEIGDIDEVCDHYSDYVEKYNAMSEKEKKKLRDEKFAKRIITEPIKKSIWDRIFG